MLFPDYFLATKAWLYLRDGTKGRVGLLGAGHSIVVSLAIAGLVFTLAREGSIAFFMGAASHILSDLTDSKGCALLYPLSDRRTSFNMWIYSADKGLVGDLRAFCSNWKSMAIESVLGIWALLILFKWVSG